jgi:putative SOS response-associated peptidase YedK
MCGRYAWGQKIPLPHPKNLPLPPPQPSVSYNRAPGQKHPIVIQGEKEAAWVDAEWGIEPEQNLSFNCPKPINARIETVLEKPIFKNSANNRRCLVPADGYFEWQKLEDQKYPHFHFLPDRTPFAMAGIWNESSREGLAGRSFAILTHSASPGLLHVHHRMPVILEPDDWADWLCPYTDLDPLLDHYAQCRQVPVLHQVSSRVNRVRESGISLTEEFSEKQSTLW